LNARLAVSREAIFPGAGGAKATTLLKYSVSCAGEALRGLVDAGRALGYARDTFNSVIVALFADTNAWVLDVRYKENITLGADNLKRWVLLKAR
jgi:hypothetical protein